MQETEGVSRELGSVMSCPHCSRSNEEHRFHFALIRKAYENWPHDHRFRPISEQHLRSWLYVEAGHTESVDIVGADAMTLEGVKAARQILSPQTYLRMEAIAGGLRISGPKSIAKGKCKKTEFREVQDRVAAIICDVIGVTAEQLVKEARAA